MPIIYKTALEGPPSLYYILPERLTRNVHITRLLTVRVTVTVRVSLGRGMVDKIFKATNSLLGDKKKVQIAVRCISGLEVASQCQ